MQCYIRAQDSTQAIAFAKSRRLLDANARTTYSAIVQAQEQCSSSLGKTCTAWHLRVHKFFVVFVGACPAVVSSCIVDACCIVATSELLCCVSRTLTRGKCARGAVAEPKLRAKHTWHTLSSCIRRSLWISVRVADQFNSVNAV